MILLRGWEAAASALLDLSLIGVDELKRYLYYCPACKLRFQSQNFGYGYPKRNADGSALCPYCETTMAQTLSETFPEEWVEARPRVEADEAAAN
jgi:hypothetical protein